MLVFFIMLVVFFILGVFGFCQIVGNIKYFEGASSAIGIIIWLAILSVAFVIGFFIAPDKYVAMILAYTISFCLSFIVKPDNNGGKAPKAKIPSHIKNREDRKNYAMYQHYIEKSEQVVEELEEFCAKIKNEQKNQRQIIMIFDISFLFIFLNFPSLFYFLRFIAISVKSSYWSSSKTSV